MKFCWNCRALGAAFSILNARTEKIIKNFEILKSRSKMSEKDTRKEYNIHGIYLAFPTIVSHTCSYKNRVKHHREVKCRVVFCEAFIR